MYKFYFLIAIAFMQLGCKQQNSIESTRKIQETSYEVSAPAHDAYRAIGTEPFWFCRWSEDSLIFEPMDGEKIINTAVDIVLDQDSITVIKGADIAMTLRKSTCSDGMSDKVYDYNAIVLVHEKMYRGCALKE